MSTLRGIQFWISGAMFINKGILVQYAVSIAVNFGSLGAGAWLSWPSIIIKPLKNGDLGYNATTSEIATMVALYDLGNMITPIPTAYMTDIFGRKPTVLLAVPFLLVATLCTIMSTNIWYLYAARLLAGMAKGISFTAVPLFIAEIAHVSIRGSLGTISQVMIGTGVSLTYILGILLPVKQVNNLYIIWPLSLAIAGIFVSETPYFLVKKGKEKEAVKSLRSYRQYESDDKRLVEEMEAVIRTVAEDEDKKARFIDVATSKSRRRALLILCLTTLFQRASGISPLLAYSTTVLPESGGGASREAYVLMLSIINVVSHSIGLMFVDTLGRKGLLILSSVLCAVMTALFAVFYQLKDDGYDVTSYNWIPYTCLLLYGFFWAVGLCIVPVVYAGELFPMNVKSYACCLMSITYAASNFVTNKAFGEVTHVAVMFYLFTGSSLLCVLFTVFFTFETKGKTFLEIQRQLDKITGTSS